MGHNYLSQSLSLFRVLPKIFQQILPEFLGCAKLWREQCPSCPPDLPMQEIHFLPWFSLAVLVWLQNRLKTSKMLLSMKSE